MIFRLHSMIKSEGVSPSKMVNDSIKRENMLSSDEEDDNLTYAQLREKRMKKNMDMFDVLGINKAAECLANSIKQNVSNVKKPTSSNKTAHKNINTLRPTLRRSLRIANIIEPEVSIDATHPIKDESSFTNNTNNESSKSNVINENSISIPEEDTEFFEKLSADLVIKEAVNDFHTCDFDKFTKVVKSLEMNERTLKVTKNRIYSIAIHPSETSLIIATGDMKGNVALSNGLNDSEVHNYHVHNNPVNCISFCTWDPLKLFSTSHDGSVRCGDIVKRTFDIIYTTDLCATEEMKYTHTTWHTEYERNLLIGNGSGRVDMIDPRISNKICVTVWCHQRSVRTVQCHPLQNHYFLTSSALGEAFLFDIRNPTDKQINPVLRFDHSRALTSAFFSASGTNMVSTSNDNFIRVFNTNQLKNEAIKPVTKIKHENCTGRWLSVFKAKWNPGRDDAFFVGSMQHPRRLQIYRSDGNILHNLMSNNMSTYCPVIEVHPTQAIHVGGNSSGRLHIFSTKEQLL